MQRLKDWFIRYFKLDCDMICSACFGKIEFEDRQPDRYLCPVCSELYNIKFKCDELKERLK